MRLTFLLAIVVIITGLIAFCEMDRQSDERLVIELSQSQSASLYVPTNLRWL